MARGTTEIRSGDSGKRIWLDGNNEESALVYILDEEVRSAKRDSSSHGIILFGATHVTVQRSDNYAFHAIYNKRRPCSRFFRIEYRVNVDDRKVLGSEG